MAYHSQPIGLVVAESKRAAENIAKLVQVTYKKPDKKPLLTIRDVLKSGDKKKIFHEDDFPRKRKGWQYFSSSNLKLYSDVSFQVPT